jgi:ubiquinone/menaquinone biosynthesis C-methylase UbiE
MTDEFSLHPHDATYLADAYDYINENSFGETYVRQGNILVEELISRINLQNVSTVEPLKLLDLGCGTGRISLQFLSSVPEYKAIEITCVDQAIAMQNVFRRKLEQTEFEKQIQFVTSPIADMNVDAGKFDMAWAVFTVLNYITDRDTLKRTISKVYEALKPNSNFIVDIAGFAFFDEKMRTEKTNRIFEFNESFLKRIVMMHNTEDPSIFTYEEYAHSGKMRFKYFHYIKLKYWTIDEFKQIMEECGFSFKCDLNRLNFTGSHFMVFEKTSTQSV